MKAWLNHFLLNLGSALSNIYYAVIPPQWTGHSKEEIDNLSSSNPLDSFLQGLGFSDDD